MNDQTVFAALLRSDLRSFVWECFQTILPGTPYLPNWHVDAIVHQLMRVQAGDISRLLIDQPPRSLKSICVSVAYVAWLLGHDPTRRIIVVSYSNEFAAELHRQFRMIIDAPWYRALFPAMRPAKDSGTELVTTAGGSRYATSIGGTLTGRGADLIIVDGPVKAEEAMSESARRRVIEWFGGTLVAGLNDKERGPIVVVMQRLHENDLAGHLFGQGGWQHLDLPFDSLVGELLEMQRHVEADRLGRLEINDKLELGWCLQLQTRRRLPGRPSTWRQTISSQRPRFPTVSRKRFSPCSSPNRFPRIGLATLALADHCNGLSSPIIVGMNSDTVG